MNNLYHIIKGILVSMDYIGELVKRAQENNINAQKLLYEIFIKEMLLLSYRIVNNTEDAKDIIQESFMSAFKNLKSLKSPEKFKPWLKRIIINNCLKKQKTRIHFLELEETIIYDDIEDNEWYKDISFEVINGEIKKLPPGCRQVLTLYLFEDYKHKEIAEIMNISESTSKSQYQRALKLLKEKLKTFLI